MAADQQITEVVDFNPPRPIKRGAVAPFVDMAALPENQRDIADVSEREFSGGGSRFQNGDTLFARITPCLENGKTAKVNSLPAGSIAHGSTEFIVMAAKAPEYDEDYVYYLARHPDFRAFAEARMEGTSGRQRVSWQALSDFSFPFPSSDQRKVIGSILRKIDDKIDLNRRINQTLEAMAQAIFKSWFVDFDPVKAKITAIERGEDPLRAAMRAISGKTNAELDQMPREQHDQLADTAALFPDAMEGSVLGEIPRRWKVVPASALIEFNPKELLRKGTVAPYLDMASLPTSGSWAEPPVPREFGSGMRFRNGDALLARITPCLENGKSAFVQNLPDETVGWGSTEFIVMRSKNPVPREYSYLLVRHATFREHAIRSMTGTSGRQRAQADAVAEFKVVSPSENSVWFAFSRLLEPCFKVIKSRSETAEKLAEIRDTLIPQLLSGELTTPSDLNDGESQ